MGGMAYMCKNRHGTYYARFIIPKHLQSHFNNKKEIRRSLQTDSRKLAIKRARVFRVQFESIVDKLMSELKKGVYHAFEATLKGKTTVTLPNGETKTVTGEITRNLASLDELQTHKQYLLDQLREEAKREEETAARQQTEKREEELHQAQLAAITAGTHAGNAALPTGKKLSEYFTDYEKHKTTPQDTGKKDPEGNPISKPVWGEGAARQNPPKLKFFHSVVQDKPASALTWEDIEQFVELAHALPKNFNNDSHKAKFQDLTVDQILDDNIKKPEYQVRKLSAVRGDFKVIIAFLKWVKKRKKVANLAEPIDSLDIAINDIKYESARRAFTPEELKTLFEKDNPAAENYVKGFNSKRGIDANLKYWLPLLGLYTGATIAELCQLHLSDIYQHKAHDDSEHWIIDINDSNDKRLKNKYRARLIPVHKCLITLGLPDYVNKLKADGEIKTFPSAKRVYGHFGAESQWFGEYSGNAGVADSDVVFHSFRHCLCSYLANKHVEDSLLTAITGHTYSTVAKTTYYRGDKRTQDIGPLVKVINSIDYGLTHPEWKN